MSWAEFKVLKDNIDAGIVSLPTLIIKDTLGIMQGKTLTITDENEYFTHQVVFPQGETVMVVTLEYMCEWEVSFVNNGNTIRVTATVDKVGGVVIDNITIVSWANGTDAEIVQKVALADAGVINLSDYWHVGDEREVTLSAMAATGVGESHVEQTATLVLMNVGGKTLTNAVESGRTTCSFVVGLKDCLKEKGYMNSTNTNVGGWTSCARRTWCNSVFKNAIPNTLAPIFKQFQNKTSAGNKSTTINTDNDYFALAAEIEIFGSTTYSASGEGAQFTWYKTAANRIKKVNGSAYHWWERSPYSGDTTSFCFVHDDGNVSITDTSHTFGLAPFGVI
jgi:hypothetical protein